MNESSAREVVLVRAVETRDAGRALWRDEDRDWATRAAAEVVGEGAPAERFLARRAALTLERLAPRQPQLARALRAVQWRSWIGVALPLAALALGLASNQLGPAQRVNILAFPLLALLAWNVAVYVLLAARLAYGWFFLRPPGLVRRLVARLGQGVVGPSAREGTLSGVLAEFGADWARASIPLLAARVARVLHLAAALFAAGAVAGMYLRGLVFEYRAGWESTFLAAEQVRAILAFALWPGSALTFIEVPNAAHIDAMRFGANGAGENAAPWIHLYATTTSLVVLVPRLWLALMSWMVERHRATHFRLPLDEPYYARLARAYSRDASRVLVVPYSYQLAAGAVQALSAVFARTVGAHAQVAYAPAVAYGDEERLPDAGNAEIVAAVFNLAATPERENQGAFLAALRAALPRTAALAALVDESAFRSRFAGDAARLEQRRAAWREACAAQGVEPVFVDLAAASPAEAAGALNAALDRHAAQAAG